MEECTPSGSLSCDSLSNSCAGSIDASPLFPSLESPVTDIKMESSRIEYLILDDKKILQGMVFKPLRTRKRRIRLNSPALLRGLDLFLTSLAVSLTNGLSAVSVDYGRP